MSGKSCAHCCGVTLCVARYVGLVSSLQSFDDIPQQDEATQKKIQEVKDMANAIKTDDELEAQMPKLLEMIDSMVDQFQDHEEGEEHEGEFEEEGEVCANSSALFFFLFFSFFWLAFVSFLHTSLHTDGCVYVCVLWLGTFVFFVCSFSVALLAALRR